MTIQNLKKSVVLLDLFFFFFSFYSMTILSSRELTCIQGERGKGVNKTQLCNDLRDPRKVCLLLLEN